MSTDTLTNPVRHPEHPARTLADRSDALERRISHAHSLGTRDGQRPLRDATKARSTCSRIPAIELTIDAASLNTNLGFRDRHLRSADFFDVANHPQVRFVSDSATLEGERLQVRGRLHAAGQSIPLELDARLRRVGDELEVDARTNADHRKLGMSHGLLGMIPHPERADRPRPAGPMSVQATHRLEAGRLAAGARSEARRPVGARRDAERCRARGRRRGQVRQAAGGRSHDRGIGAPSAARRERRGSLRRRAGARGGRALGGSAEPRAIVGSASGRGRTTGCCAG